MIATERLYYTDSYLRRFEAQVIGSVDNRVYLDRTAFYPTSGGQPHDVGWIGGVPVQDVVDEDQRIAHVLGGPVPDGPVHCDILWSRRFGHMQQHTGQHLLSAVLMELYQIETLSFHLGAEASTIDVRASGLLPEQLRRAEARVNEVVFENRPMNVSFADPSENLGLRKPSDREGILRIVSIPDLDRSACGGTHVRSTAEIGPVVVRKVEKIRSHLRLEFLCGLRFAERAQADFEALSKLARLFSASLDETPAVVRALLQHSQELDKAYRKLSTEAAAREGRDLYASTLPSANGVRAVLRDAAIDDSLRAEAQSFTALPKSLFVAFSANPPSVLVAASKDSGIHAGELVKAALTAHGGRGGGSPVLGQGSVPSGEALDHVRRLLAAHCDA